MVNNPTPKTIQENLETKVIEEADVVVVGGGPGGHSAAIAAARNGAQNGAAGTLWASRRYGYRRHRHPDSPYE